MVNFIQEFFYGNIDPQARGIRCNSEAQQISNMLSQTEELLAKKLTEDDLKLFRDYTKAWAELLEVTDLDSFISGFRYGAGFTYDTFVSDGRPYYDFTKNNGPAEQGHK